MGGVPAVPMPAGTQADVALAFTQEILRTLKQERQAIDFVPEALRQPGGYGSLGDTPLAVIRRGWMSESPSKEDRAWQATQEALSTRSFLVVAQNAGHVIPYEEPSVVADTVRRVLDELENK